MTATLKIQQKGDLFEFLSTTVRQSKTFKCSQGMRKVVVIAESAEGALSTSKERNKINLT